MSSNRVRGYLQADNIGGVKWRWLFSIGSSSSFTNPPPLGRAFDNGMLQLPVIDIPIQVEVSENVW